MRKFCPKCGKRIKEGILCKECKEIEIAFKEVNIKLCPSKKVFYKGKWSDFKNLRELTNKLIKDNVKQQVEVLEGLETNPEILQKPGLKRIHNVVVTDGEAQFLLPIKYEITYSPGMAKAGTEYFEGILQLRNLAADAKKEIKKILSSYGKDFIINKVTEKDTSLDLYLADKKYLRPIAQKIINKYSGTMEENAQLFSRNKQTSKDIYRVNVLVTLPDFREGDVILYEDEPIHVTGTQKRITGFNLEKEKRTSFKYDEEAKEKISLLKKHKTTVSQTMPDIMVLHPETYQEIRAKNISSKEFSPGHEARVVIHKEKAYII